MTQLIRDLSTKCVKVVVVGLPPCARYTLNHGVNRDVVKLNAYLMHLAEDAPPPKLRKVDRENRSFQIRWEEEYFFTLDVEADKPVCLVCRELCSVKKEFNLKRHYTRQHEAEYKNLKPDERVAKVFTLKTEFLASKQKQADEAGPANVLNLQKPEWIKKLAFSVDVTQHLNSMNVSLQGKDNLISDMFQIVIGFEQKLGLFVSEIEKGDLFHFPHLKSLGSLAGDFKREFVATLNTLKEKFKCSFQDFRKLEMDIAIFSDPFSVNVSEVPSGLKLNLIDLQLDRSLKLRYLSVPLKEFYSSLGNKYENIVKHAMKMFALFSSSYICEQLFSLMKYAKSKFRSRLTDENLLSQLRIMSRNSVAPDFQELMLKRRSQGDSRLYEDPAELD
ncbi:hypothetical protein FOCC_FOCC004064 [Frankliniella occidentalis]|nr:hypothetical protein FOCC_FOCC004064 [Frankliniella occidentalis]